MTQSDQRYARASIILHWAMLALLVGVYACIELRELYPRGSDPREALKTWHFMLGLTVFALVWIRMAARLFGKTPPIMPAAPKWQRLVADIVELALYILMFILPLLGWVTLSAEGDPIPFFGLELPALVAPNESLAERTEDLHKTLGTAGYYLIALHALAALYHHYVRRDNTLRRMMLSRGRTEPEPRLR
ncbi:MAG: cytochrome b [Xanthomonadaceae bacterium]|nr:cytochrome b [Xanthomonadaceae bacterium]